MIFNKLTDVKQSPHFPLLPFNYKISSKPSQPSIINCVEKLNDKNINTSYLNSNFFYNTLPTNKKITVPYEYFLTVKVVQ